MGKTNQPLLILVTGSGDFQRLPVWRALEEKGHAIHYYAPPEPFDMIIGPECWRINEQLVQHVDEVMKVSRKIKAAATKKDKSIEKKASTGKKVRRRENPSRPPATEST